MRHGLGIHSCPVLISCEWELGFPAIVQIFVNAHGETRATFTGRLPVSTKLF